MDLQESLDVKAAEEAAGVRQVPPQSIHEEEESADAPEIQEKIHREMDLIDGLKKAVDKNDMDLEQ